MSSPEDGGLTVQAPAGAPEFAEGDDLAVAVLALAELRDGDVVAVTSKVVAKVEGRVIDGNREGTLKGETLRVVARRGDTTIVRNRLGLTMAAAGIDASNVVPGRVALLPLDPDDSARRLRRDLAERAGVNAGVIVTDTAGRAWRHGQTDIAIGAAGIPVVESFDGRDDGYGNRLEATAPAVADELAGAAELAQGKLSRRPFAVIRGRADLVLPPGEDGPGAAAIIRDAREDLFGYGAREAVLRALTGDPADRAGFGERASAGDLAAAVRALLGAGSIVSERSFGLVVRGPAEVVRTLAFAHGWHAGEPDSAGLVLVRP